MARATDRADKIYDVAAFFAQECLIGDRSLLWPDRKVWTTENLEHMWQAFVLQPDVSDRSFTEKLPEQLSGSSSDVYRLATEVTAIYCLFPYYKQMGPASKKKLIQTVQSFEPDIGEPDRQRWSMLEEALNEDGVARPGVDYNTGRPFHIGYYLAFAMEIKRRGLTTLESVDPVELAVDALKHSQAAMNFTTNGSRNAVLNLFWPDKFETTASNDHKQRMAANLSALYELTVPEDIDEALYQIRMHMETEEGFLKDFDMYSEKVRPLWDFKPTRSGSKPKSSNKSKSKPTTPKATNDLSSSKDTTAPTIQDLAARTYLSESFLEDIDTLLKSKKQLIFEGPPGSGKTFVADMFARYFTGQALEESEPIDQIELVQFHQSYSYEDFVEGIRPRTNDDGQLVYDIEPGIFQSFATKATANPDKKFVLIIDEINRGNISRILGELMLLLEYRKKSARLPYSKEHLRIPPNLYIIGTMNSADRSLSQIDYALRRRFYFIRLMAMTEGRAPVLESWLREQHFETAVANRILATFIELNLRLQQHMETDDLQVGHSYFMDVRIGDENHRQHVWRYAIIPLIREYLYHHRGRDELLRSYELSSFSTIVEPIADDLGESVESVIREEPDGDYE